MERAAFSQLTNHLENNHLLDSHQSAYRSNHSVETVLLGLSDHVLQEMDQGRVTAVVLLDVSAAFDTVQHNILLERLESSGVTDRALQWFSSYLTDRQQRTSINGVSSPSTPLTHGVPTRVSGWTTSVLGLYKTTWRCHSFTWNRLPLLCGRFSIIHLVRSDR